MATAAQLEDTLAPPPQRRGFYRKKKSAVSQGTSTAAKQAIFSEMQSNHLEQIWSEDGPPGDLQQQVGEGPASAPDIPAKAAHRKKRYRNRKQKKLAAADTADATEVTKVPQTAESMEPSPRSDPVENLRNQLSSWELAEKSNEHFQLSPGQKSDHELQINTMTDVGKTKQQKGKWPKFRYYKGRGAIAIPGSFTEDLKSKINHGDNEYTLGPVNTSEEPGWSGLGESGSALAIVGVPITQGQRTMSGLVPEKVKERVVTLRVHHGNGVHEEKPEQQGGCQVFTLFSELPTELRLAIWKMVLRFPQTSVLKLRTANPFQFEFARHSTSPPVFSVCRESREEALSHYELCFGNKAYFRYATDSLFFRCRKPCDLVHLTNCLTGDELQKVHSLVLTLRDWINSDAEVFRMQLWKFAQLKKLYLLVGRGDGKYMHSETKNVVRNEIMEGREDVQGEWKAPRVYLVQRM